MPEHYTKRKRLNTGHGSKKKRFLSKVRKSDGCWEWMAAKNGDGYGRFAASTRPPRIEYAHRVSYEMFVGEIPAGLQVLHDCDNPACVNPSHLHTGTHTENMKEALHRDRLARGERAGASVLRSRDVIEIRNRYSKGNTQVEIACEFSVSQATVSKIVRGESWAHVGGPRKENK